MFARTSGQQGLLAATDATGCQGLQVFHRSATPTANSVVRSTDCGPLRRICTRLDSLFTSTDDQ
jgi:hypothetical protein